MTVGETQSSAVERLETALKRIQDFGADGSAAAFTALFAESARQEAWISDRRLAAGTSPRPLEGRIVSVKALFDVAGTTTSAGSAVLRRLPPAREDAVIVQRLRAAGALVIGKTQMTEFAFSAVGTNPHDRVPGNPRDRARAPGGSSSGAVVSVIDGVAEIAVGSDTGGSIRIPSALCGAVGFKPTSGRVTTDGAFSLSSSLDTIGPIALSVADCHLAGTVLAGERVAPLQAASIDAFRLIIARGRPFDRCEPEVLEAFENAVELLRSHGVLVENGSIESALCNVAKIDRIGTFPSIEVTATLAGLGIANLDGVDPRTRVRIEAGRSILASDYVRMTRLRKAAIQSFARSFTDNEVYIVPTVPIRAPLLSALEDDARFHDVNGLLLRNPRIANLLDCPSISLPLPMQGLPIGLMMIGRRNSDQRLLEIATQIESLLRP